MRGGGESTPRCGPAVPAAPLACRAGAALGNLPNPPGSPEMWAWPECSLNCREKYSPERLGRVAKATAAGPPRPETVSSRPMACTPPRYTRGVPCVGACGNGNSSNRKRPVGRGLAEGGFCPSLEKISPLPLPTAHLGKAWTGARARRSRDS